MKRHSTQEVMKTACVAWLVMSFMLGLVNMSLTQTGDLAPGSWIHDSALWAAVWIYNVLILILVLVFYICIDDDRIDNEA